MTVIRRALVFSRTRRDESSQTPIATATFDPRLPNQIPVVMPTYQD
jgi:hypothetical protein